MVELNFKNGRVAVVVQDQRTGDVLTTGEMDAAAWERSLAEGYVALTGGDAGWNAMKLLSVAVPEAVNVFAALS